MQPTVIWTALRQALDSEESALSQALDGGAHALGAPDLRAAGPLLLEVTYGETGDG